MTYVIAKHKKNGTERIFTEPVFRANEHQYKFVSYTDNPNKEKKAPTVTATPSVAAPRFEANKGVEKKAPDDDVTDSVLTDLQSQYKALTGKTANKKWGVPKLTEQIKKAENPTA